MRDKPYALYNIPYIDLPIKKMKTSAQIMVFIMLGAYSC